MKKRVVGIFIISIILLSFLSLSIIAQESETDDTTPEEEEEEDLTGVDKAYQCLEDKLGDNCANSDSTIQTALSLLAIGYDSSLQKDCKDDLIDKKKSDNCWGTSGSGSCDIKSTALAILALDHIGQDTTDYVDWLLEHRIQSTNLNWFLEIDSSALEEATTCTILTNDASEKQFTINKNKKIVGSNSCLSPAESNYFLKISNSCIGKNFTTSCDRDFITTLLYKKLSEQTYYVSSKTHTGSTDGETLEKVDAYCFGVSGCDYEGSLWATIAMAKVGEDSSIYIPYLASLTTENKKYFPSTFLYMLTAQDSYQSDIVEKQKIGNYWLENTNKYYDTSLAFLSLQGLLLDEVNNAKDYVLSTQDGAGCIGTVSDTAFILFSSWGKDPVISGGNGGDDGGSAADCETFGFFCTSAGECTDNKLDNYDCSGFDICCELEPKEASCTDKSGIICALDQECTGSEVFASDTAYCCLESCQEVSLTTECEDYSYSCKSSCGDDEDEKLYDCNSGQTCCTPKPKAKTNWWIIILLIILIILVALAIVFRDQLKMWWFNMQNKFKKGGNKGQGTKPTSPPPGSPPLFGGKAPTRPMPMGRPGRRPMGRPGSRPMPMGRPVGRPGPRPPAKSRATKDSNFEETMKKLKKMSK